MGNPIFDFSIDKPALQYVGHDLQRPECILAEPDGSLWVADDAAASSICTLMVSSRL